MNISIILGRLTKTPEIKSSASGTKVINFTLAINKKYKDQDQTSYINCVAFNKTAEIIAAYTEKGSRLLVQGELQSRSYDNKEGQKVYTTEIIVSQITLLDSKKDSKEPEVDLPPSPRTEKLNDPYGMKKREEEAKAIMLDDDSLPFW